MTEADTALDTLCRDLNLTCSARLLGYESDTSAPKDKRWAHFAWRVTLKLGERSHETAYKTGIGHVNKKCPGHYSENAWLSNPKTPKIPSAADVLASLLSDAQCAEGTFENFCSNLGYDTDSRKALDTYLACQATGTEMRRFLGEHYRVVCDAATEY